MILPQKESTTLVRTKKQLSLVLPVYNEAEILEEQVVALRAAAAEQVDDDTYEILIVENGSRDGTIELAQKLAETYDDVRTISLAKPSYGAALKHGILEANAELVMLYNIDFWNVDFLVQAARLCKTEGCDIVVGSKTMPGANDERSWLRRLITKSFNLLLRVWFGFRGTDTHGMKLLRRDRILDVLNACVTEREVFDTELLLRAQKCGHDIRELPVTCRELRQSTYGILHRIPRTLKDLWILHKSLRRKK